MHGVGTITSCEWLISGEQRLREMVVFWKDARVMLVPEEGEDARTP